MPGEFRDLLRTERTFSVLQDLENFVPLDGDVRSPVEQGGQRVVIFSKPLDVGDTRLVFCHLVGEIAGFFAQIVFCGGEDSLMLLVRVLGDDQACAGSRDDTD